MIKQISLRGLLLVLAIFTAACTAPSFVRYESAMRLAGGAWMIERDVNAGPFYLKAFERMYERQRPANVYIEGLMPDYGRMKVLPNQAVTQPIVGLHLATRDLADNLAYLSRPCQFSTTYNYEAYDPYENCEERFAGKDRLSPEVIKAYSRALDDIASRYDIKGFHLTGFGDGGALALLLALERSDVLSVRTVAGVLDHGAYTSLHGLESYSGSLNPASLARKLVDIPQYHFIGGQDKVVPPSILHSYLQALGPTHCVQYEFVQNASHMEGWVSKWPELLEQKPVCKGIRNPVVLPQSLLMTRDVEN